MAMEIRALAAASIYKTTRRGWFQRPTPLCCGSGSITRKESMNMKRFLLLIVALGVLGAAPGRGADLVVIAHPDLHLSQISADELRAVFLGVKTSIKESGEVQPVL